MMRLAYWIGFHLTRLAIEAGKIFFPWLFKNLKKGAKVAGQKMQEHQTKQKLDTPAPQPKPHQPVKMAPRAPAPTAPPMPAPTPQTSPASNTATVEKPTMLMLVEDIKATDKTKPLFELPPENHKIYASNAHEIWEKFDPEIERNKLIDTSQPINEPLDLPPLEPETDFINEEVQPIPPEDHRLYSHQGGKIYQITNA